MLKVLKSVFKVVAISFIFLSFSCKKEASYIKKELVNKHFISDKIIDDSEFLGDQKCKECHKEEYKKWQGSHHDKAMQKADNNSILGDFNDVIFKSKGVTSIFYKKDGYFYVNTEGRDGKNHDFKILYTFGLTPLQQYIVQFPDGHLQCLRTAWDTEKKKWFDLYPDFKVVHKEWLHWSKGGLNWNNMCADCHSTNVRKNYSIENHSYNTKISLLNVSCEACHGPGKNHVNTAEKLKQNYISDNSLQMTITTPPKELVDKCARCHVRREQFSKNYNYQGSLLDHYFPQLITNPIYHPDGQILDEVYVYGSFVQSKMYQKGVTCNNCHDAHTTKLKFDGNKLCYQCHNSTTYNSKKHHFHDLNTEASKCINCHMTGKYYMGNDFRRDHSFRIPRPDLSVKYNTPNACTGCHTDKDNNWANTAFKQLFGEVDSIHFSEKLAPGILGKPNAHVGLLELIADKNQPEIIRASAVSALANYNVSRFVTEYIKLLDDDKPMVRATALDVLSEINTTDYVSSFLPLLNDEKRTVRIKAFFALAGLPESEIPLSLMTTYQKVKKEFFIHLNTNNDFAGSRVKRANYHLKKGEIAEAIFGYKTALKIDPTNAQITLMLAQLFYNNQELENAEKTFKKVIALEPKFGETYYSLALLYGELNRIEEAIEQLKKAKQLMPKNIRIYYNLGILYFKTNQFKAAEKAIKQGLQKAPQNQDLLYVLAYQYYTSNNINKAIPVARELVYLFPKNRQYQSFLNKMLQESAN